MPSGGLISLGDRRKGWEGEARSGGAEGNHYGEEDATRLIKRGQNIYKAEQVEGAGTRGRVAPLGCGWWWDVGKGVLE